MQETGYGCNNVLSGHSGYGITVADRDEDVVYDAFFIIELLFSVVFIVAIVVLTIDMRFIPFILYYLNGGRNITMPFSSIISAAKSSTRE